METGYFLGLVYRQLVRSDALSRWHRCDRIFPAVGRRVRIDTGHRAGGSCAMNDVLCVIKTTNT